MAVEYLGPRAVEIMRQEDHNISNDAESLIMLEQDAESDEQMMDYLENWWELFAEMDVLDTMVAQSYDEIEHHKFLRHKVPETVNALVRSYGQAKLGTDCAVPESQLAWLFDQAFAVGKEFEAYQWDRQPLDKGEFGYAVWAHAGDSHVHLNLLPRNDEEDEQAKSFVTKLLKEVVAKHGTIAAEHGLGKKEFDHQPALLLQYGTNGMDQIRAMKLAIDPKELLNSGNLIPI